MEVAIEQRQEYAYKAMAETAHRHCLDHRQGLKQKQAHGKKEEDLPISPYKSHRLKNHNDRTSDIKR